MAKDSIEEKVREFYDSDGWVADEDGVYGEEHYFRKIEGTRGAYGKQVESLPAELLGGIGGTVLIAGGGDLPAGHLLVVEQFQRAICVDISRRALEISETKLGKKAQYYNASILKIPLPNDLVDAVFSAHMLYHIDKKNQQKAVRELLRVTKIGGRILIVYLNPNSPLMIIQRFLKFLRVNRLLKKNKLYLYAFPVSWWSQFRDAGIVSITPYDCMSTNQAKALIPSAILRKKFYSWASGVQTRKPSLAAKYWTYVAISIEKTK